MPNQIDLARAVRPICGPSGRAATKRWLAISGLATLLMLTLSAFVLGPALAADIDDSLDAMQIVKYWDVLDEYKAKGYAPVEGQNIVIPSTSYSAAGAVDGSEAPKLTTISSIGGRSGKFLQWNDQGWVEWKVTVPATGLYNIAADYFPVTGTRSSIQRALTIDGKVLFNENKIEFKRTWINDNETYNAMKNRDNQGNSIRPKQIEHPVWRSFAFSDLERIYEDPFLFYLTAGVHVIRLEAIREPIVFGDLRVSSPEIIPSYAEVKKTYDANGYTESKGYSSKVQAESTWLKSDATMRPEYGGDSLNEPPSKGRMVLNEFGGWRYRIGGQFASWKISAPKDGLYQIGFREWQGFSDQKPSIRSLKVDGVIPFYEFKEVYFPYDNRHQNLFIPSGKDGKPYLVYLTKGTHVLEMEVRVGPFRETLRTLEYVAREMGRMARKIVLVTGPDPDPNTEWELEKTIPALLPTLSKLAKMLDEQVVNLTKLCGRRPVSANSLAMVSDQLKSMVKEPQSIAGRFDQFSASQASLSTWMQSLRWHMLILDWVWVASPDAEKPRAVPTAWERTSSTMSSFLISFSKDYTGIGSSYKDKKGQTIDVWVGRGREWAEIIKNMAEDDFTPATGIRVNMNILPVGDTQTMLLSCISGRAPDVALGVPGTIPVDFAIRGAIVNMNKFPDYKEVAKRFRPGALVPFRYRGGDWAVPEDQDFIMMYYRTDVLAQVGIKEVPRTWEEVYKMLPILQQSGLEFYFPPGLFTPFLFQRGGDYYTKDGLRSALDTPSALKAFEEWTDLYTKYKIQKQASFFNRIRTGEMPIGVEGYPFYLQLSTAAPELTGWWKMVPLPGHMRPDGSVDRTVGGGSNVAVMFKTVKGQADPKRVDAAWEFVKWWTSADAQSRFGSELEALLGSEARWNTANQEALMALPWPKEHKAAIKEEWAWFREAPYVVGGYFSGRHITNAWNRVVLDGMNPRESLEISVKDINKELARKQEEFGITAKSGKKQAE